MKLIRLELTLIIVETNAPLLEYVCHLRTVASAAAIYGADDPEKKKQRGLEEAAEASRTFLSDSLRHPRSETIERARARAQRQRFWNPVTRAPRRIKEKREKNNTSPDSVSRLFSLRRFLPRKGRRGEGGRGAMRRAFARRILI